MWGEVVALEPRPEASSIQSSPGASQSACDGLRPLSRFSCAWCGSPSHTVCGRCKVYAYCSIECQRLHWKAGHRTSCTAAAAAAGGCQGAEAAAHSCSLQQNPPTDEPFQYFHVPYVVHWAINLESWGLEQGSREFEFLLARLPDKASRASIKTAAAAEGGRGARSALARELAVRRLAEVTTQAMWHKVEWRRDEAADRDYLSSRTPYIWTGQKYINSNLRFPNFNFSMVEGGGYLFVVSHPLAVCGVFGTDASLADVPDARTPEMLFPRSDLSAGSDNHTKLRSGGEAEVDPDEDLDVFSEEEAAELSVPPCSDERRRRVRRGLAAKMAYFRAVGRTRGRRWSQVSVRSFCSSKAEGGKDDTDAATSSAHEAPTQSPQRLTLRLQGVPQRKWRFDVHEWRGHCVVVCRGPPHEVEDVSGGFWETQALKFLDSHELDDALEHDEPKFIEVPPKMLLPKRWHSDYERACGRGERGEQVRMNR